MDNPSPFIRSRQLELQVCNRVLKGDNIDLKRPKPNKGLVAELVEAFTGFTRSARVRFTYNPLFELP